MSSIKTKTNKADKTLYDANGKQQQISAAKAQAILKEKAAEQQQKWISNALVDDSGKYYVVPELAYKNIEANKGWRPCFYIVTNDHKLIRIGLNFAIELAKADKAIELSKERVK